MVAVGAFGLFTFFFGTFQCWPISKFWVPEEDGFCFSGTQIALLNYAHSTVSTVADWSCGILPFLMVRKSNMPKGVKATVIVILGIGSMYVMTLLTLPMLYLASANGFVTLAEASRALCDTSISAASKGMTFFVRTRPATSQCSAQLLNLLTQPELVSTTDLAIWSSVEVGLGIIAGSIATFRPLLRIALRKTRLGSSSAGGVSDYPTGWSRSLAGSHPPTSAAAQFQTRNLARSESRKDLILETFKVVRGPKSENYSTPYRGLGALYLHELGDVKESPSASDSIVSDPDLDPTRRG
jgi:hypothetical protein